MLNYVEVAPLFYSVVYVGFSAVLSFSVLPVSRLCVSPSPRACGVYLQPNANLHEVSTHRPVRVGFMPMYQLIHRCFAPSPRACGVYADKQKA